MSITVCIYEDSSFSQFLPLTSLRPVYTLRPGIFPLFMEASRKIPEADIFLICRDQLAPLLAESIRDFPVNLIKCAEDQPVLLLNGRIRDYGNLPEQVASAPLSGKFVHQGQTVGVLLKPEIGKELPAVCSPTDLQNLVEKHGDQLAQYDTTATLYNYSWEIMADIESQITQDFESNPDGPVVSPEAEIDAGATLINRENMSIGNNVAILPTAVLNASNGPIVIGSYTRIEPQVVINGPCYIGPNCIITTGKISGSSIGHTCRVGGEVEASVFHAYVNKYHEGFIGHSYVGQWVNFGAMTTNSDLKNNYASIRLRVDGQDIESGSNKVGSFIGDHTKFGIGTLLNTGINIGVCCNIFGGSLVSDREVPPFQWGTTGKYDSYRFDKAIETARMVAVRRDCTLSRAEADLLKAISRGEATSDGTLTF